jgi:[glutamine synthetase] adenylyltransferase / [glutamine synthetase]-adenylyl-L-tyrosine phosphorylase
VSPELQRLIAAARARLDESAKSAAALAAASAAVRDSIDRVFAASDFVANGCARDEDAFVGLMTADRLTAAVAPTELAASLAAELQQHAGASAADEAEFMTALRKIRRREMMRIAWRDIAGWATVDETLTSLSVLADALIQSAVDYARVQLREVYGTPRDALGADQPLIVVGMGKLGGGELNFSSDVDLVFLFPSAGDTDGRRSIANEEYFARLGRVVIKLLDAPTADGFVLRVDMRLRPFGDSGPLATSASFFEGYLETHGRDWERYAWVKARAITGVAAYAAIYEGSIRPFVYRRYLDFGMFDALREMKALIEREVARRELNDHVKLGPGGIREIEFIVQAVQLVRGGQDRRLQTQSLREALPRLAGSKLLEPAVVRELGDAYRFLRKLENALQMLADQQTHTLPAGSLERERLTIALQFPSWEALAVAIEQRRALVSRHFRDLLAGEAKSQSANGGAAESFGALWERGGTSAEFAAVMADTLPNAEPCAVQLAELRGSSLVRRLDAVGRKRLDVLIARLVAELPRLAEPSAVLKRIVRIIEAIGPRSAYFALLNENAVARARLIELCGHGEFLSAQLAASPILLDELIDESLFGAVPRRAELEQDAAEKLLGVGDDDPEREVEALRHFQRAAVFRVAVADLTGRLPLMQVSDALTEIAEIIVEHAMRLAWRQMTAQFGTPQCGVGEARRSVRVCAVAYGKLGGRELGYGSDLDLVFLHDSSGERQETDAEKPTDNQVFFVRLAQRIVHLLTMHSAAGRLYEVDQRLRPSGKGGMLITQIDAFADYQKNEAWTWEHQALLHARAVAGDSELRARFEQVRDTALQRDVKRAGLAREVGEMRERMRRELSRAKPGQLDLKQDRGGVADIEFLAQYWALLYAASHPPVAMFSDTIRQLESVASADLVPQADVDVLTHAYRVYRARTHRLSLEGAPPLVDATDFTNERAAVATIWNRTLGASV